MTARPPAFLPYGRQSITDADIAAVSEVLRSDYLTTGPAVARFEESLKRRCGDACAVAVSNGTAALHLALAALGFGPGHTAIVPSVTFLATANAARLCGGEVVFADVDPVTGLLTAESCRNALDRATSPVRAILPVHLGGRMVDTEAISVIAKEVGAAIVEDACHAFGGRDRQGNPVGASHYSDATVFSFHPVKTIAAGEGGAVMCRDPALAERVRLLRSHGMVRTPSLWNDAEAGFTDGLPNPWYYEMPEVGLNYRIPDILCALADSQMQRLDAFIVARDDLARYYDSRISEAGLPIRPVPRAGLGGGAWHLYQVAIDFEALGQSRGALMRNLLSKGIGSQVHYIPVHHQPYYRTRYGLTHLPGADKFYAETLSLPLYPDMHDIDVDHVVETLKDALKPASSL